MTNIWIEIIIYIVLCLITYFLFRRLGFKGGYILKIVLEFLYLYYTKDLINMYQLGIVYLLLTIIAVLLFEALITGIEYFIFDRVPNFLLYIIIASIIEYFIKFAITFIISFIAILNLKGNNLTSFKEQVNYTKSAIDLNIDFINVGTRSDLVSLDYACNNPNEVIPKIVSTLDVNYECSINQNQLGENVYIFKLIGINKYSGYTGEIICKAKGCE